MDQESANYAEPGTPAGRRGAPLLQLAVVFAIVVVTCLLLPPLLFLAAILIFGMQD
jgi:uncharacterized membrane protein YdbT with pleckstrin-like domain